MPISVILPILVGIPSAGPNFPLCTINMAHLLIPNIMLMSLLKVSTVLTNAFDSFSAIAYRSCQQK